MKKIEALKDLCRNQPLTIQMSMYGGFEQVGSIGTALPQNDVQTTTTAGDDQPRLSSALTQL